MTLRGMGSIGDLIVHAIERHGDRIAFEDKTRRFTYAQLGQDVARTIAFFEKRGLVPGDRVAQISANRYEMFVVIAAAYVGGYVSLALQYNSDLDEHSFAIDDCTPALLMADDERMARAADLSGTCTHSFIAAGYDEIGLDATDPVQPIGAFLGRTDPDQCGRMNYTGGTSGRPKAVMISSAALTFTNLAHVSANAFDGDTRFLVSSPISHGGGSFIIPVLSKGGRVIIHDRFSPADVVAAVTAGQVNSMLLIPTMLYTLLDHPDVARIERGQIRRIIYGGAPASPPRLKQTIELFGPVLLQSFGQSEAPGTILYLSPEDHVSDDPDRLASAGRPYFGVTVKLMSEGREVPLDSGEVGELWVRGPHVMMGYWNAPELTEKAFEDGWLRTGDLARADGQGFIHIVDRLKDMIISGGFNVYAAEVEQALDQHPAVATSAVIGVPDPKWGEAVTAFVVTHAGQEVAAPDLAAFVKSRKGPVKTPKTINFVTELPLTKVGKIDKKVLRSAYWQDNARGVN